MKVTATQIKARDLKPGELFSNRGPMYWQHLSSRVSIGEAVYLRTETPADSTPDADEWIYKIEIEK